MHRSRRALPAVLAALSFLAVSGASALSCSLGNGVGTLNGTLDVQSCWEGPFDLKPDFFAAVPYMDTLQLRIQRGGDFETFSDGVEIQIDDLATIRKSEYGKALVVSLPPGVTPPAVPIAPNPNPSIVHMALYLQATCQIQDVALYALESVSLNAQGTCDPPGDGGELTISCPGSTGGLAPIGDAGPPADASPDATITLDAAPPDGAVSEGGAGGEAGAADSGSAISAGAIGHSTITFTSLFDGDPNEVSAAARLNAGRFDVYLADPREVCPGGVGPPPPCRGHIAGEFNFYFERGRPAQPFP